MGFTCPDCDTYINGTNCAHSLSRKKGWKKISGCTSLCKCGYPVRSKDVRKYIYSGTYDKDKKKTGYIYCEDYNGGGHVYYGTYDKCVIGNGTAAKDTTVYIFERYTSTSY